VTNPILLVGIGDITRPGSTIEIALRFCLRQAEILGARAELFCGAELMLALFEPSAHTVHTGASKLVASMRSAEGIVIASPSYHGSISGLVKNVLDYTELMRDGAAVL
jgi:FMN reductase